MFGAAPGRTDPDLLLVPEPTPATLATAPPASAEVA